MSSSSSSSSSPSSSPSPSPKPISWASGGGGWGGYGYGYVVCGRGWGPGYRRLVSLACVVECCQARRQCRHCAVCHQHRLVHVNVSAERRVLVHPQPAASAQLLLDGLACGRLARQLSWELLVWHAHAATVLYLVLHAVKLRSEVGSAARHAATAATPDSCSAASLSAAPVCRRPSSAALFRFASFCASCLSWATCCRRHGHVQCPMAGGCSGAGGSAANLGILR